MRLNGTSWQVCVNVVSTQSIVGRADGRMYWMEGPCMEGDPFTSVWLWQPSDGRRGGCRTWWHYELACSI